MKQISCDVAIIGAGSAGLAARNAAVAARTIIVEAGDVGTTCARCGCMPSKLLLRAAAAKNAITKAKQFGVDSGSVVGRLRCVDRC